MNTYDLKPSQARQLLRRSNTSCLTSNWCRGYAKAGLVVLPKEDAYDFLLFCNRNPKPCPILDVTDVGSPEPRGIARDSDIRFDLPCYRVYQKGEAIDEPYNISRYWNNSMIAFLIGCSFSFDDVLLKAGVPLRHIELGTNTGVYNTSIKCRKAGRFFGNLVVSMRPIPGKFVSQVVNLTSRLPLVHGSPVHIGDPDKIGIEDIFNPEWGDPPVLNPGDVLMFWACSVTPQVVALKSKPSLMITHLSGNMFITDIPIESLFII